MKLISCSNCGVVLDLEEFQQLELESHIMPVNMAIIFVRPYYRDKSVVCPVCQKEFSID